MFQIKCQLKDHKEMDCEWVCLEQDCKGSRFLCQYCILVQQKQKTHKNSKLIYQQQQVEPEIEKVQNLYNESKNQMEFLKEQIQLIQELIQRLQKTILSIQIEFETLSYFNIQSRNDFNKILEFFSNNLIDGNLKYDCKELNFLKLLSKITKTSYFNEVKNQIEQLIDYIDSNIGKAKRPKIRILSIQQEYNDLLSTQSGDIDNNYQNCIQIQDVTDYIEQNQNQKYLYQFDGIIQSNQDKYNDKEVFSLNEIPSKILDKSQ